MNADLYLKGAGDRPAILGVEGPPLTYAALARHLDQLSGALRGLGAGADDAIGVVLPNGPEMAVAFLASALAGISAPLNPAYRREELAFYLGDLEARLLLIDEQLDSPARDVARERGIRIVEIGRQAGTPGLLTLDGVLPDGGGLPAPDLDAPGLILHTSGTTSRPKMVPLSHRNLTSSAAHIAATLALTPADCCLNVMPLFHIHGLMAALLASLRAGGSVACSPGFLAPRFFPWVEAVAPTWYTAVPTIHQSVLARADDPDARRVLARRPFRFVRSSSAALPSRVMGDLEAALGAPVIEAYGMTEAAHQMASNPLPPGERKPGTVGRAAGPEIAVLGADGTPLPPGTRGEVAIRGPNVTAGYRNNPTANAQAFSHGWLRTGDEGQLDADGYLTLTGRIKEQINRAGEKIAPREVDEVLLDHPAVASALAFGLPHPILGEDIAAAVVLKPGATATEQELRSYVAGRLAYFKVPRRVLCVNAIPTGPTGKLQRIGLAERLGLTADVPVDDHDTTPATTPTEEIVALAWTEVMGRAPAGIRRNFFALGGDSILATMLVGRLRVMLGVDLPLLSFFDAPTVERAAAAVAELMAREAGPPPGAARPRRTA